MLYFDGRSLPFRINRFINYYYNLCAFAVNILEYFKHLQRLKIIIYTHVKLLSESINLRATVFNLKKIGKKSSLFFSGGAAVRWNLLRF